MLNLNVWNKTMETTWSSPRLKEALRNMVAQTANRSVFEYKQRRSKGLK